MLRVHGRSIFASVCEVGRLLGLPTEGATVEELCDSDEENLRHLRDRYNLGPNTIKLTDLERSLEYVEGDEFKGRFVLYAITAILSPTTSLNVKSKYVGLLKNLDKCASLNWSKFTFDGMVQGVELFKQKRLSNEEHQQIGGCILILKVMYLCVVLILK